MRRGRWKIKFCTTEYLFVHVVSCHAHAFTFGLIYAMPCLMSCPLPLPTYLCLCHASAGRKGKHGVKKWGTSKFLLHVYARAHKWKRSICTFCTFRFVSATPLACVAGFFERGSLIWSFSPASISLLSLLIFQTEIIREKCGAAAAIGDHDARHLG